MTLSAPRRGRMLLIVQAAALAALFAGAMPAQAQQGATAPGASASEATHSKSGDSYSLGVSLGGQLHDAGVTAQDVNGERVGAGVRDALTGKARPGPEDQRNIDGLVHHTHAGAAAPGAASAHTTAPDSAHNTSAASYSLGVTMGAQLHASGVTPQDVGTERLTAGMQDALAGKVKPSPQDQQNIVGLITRARARAGESNHRAAAAFMAENGRKKGIITTASGLQYKVLKAGSGTSPQATDEVVVNYRGSLLNGTEFDSSYRRGEPASFPVNHVIPGWTEALQLMKPGAKYQLFIPPKLAYDLNSPPGSAIPPGSLLVFDVELLSIK